MSKFVITGGHHNSALVVARELIARGHRVEWIGHRHAAVGDNNDSAEYIEVTASHIPFHDLVAGKTSFTISNLLNIPLGLMRAIKMLKRLNPDGVISFGGYLGLSVSLAAYLQKFPIFLHEQTVIAGKANKLSSRLAVRVYLTWDSSLVHYPSNKSLVVGLPLRESFKHPKQVKLFKNNKPTLLFLCGKQGSHIINKLIFANLLELVTKYNLIHQTGTSSATGDYDKAVSLKEALPQEFSSSYLPHGYIGEESIADLIASADLVVGRSGAHTTYELAILGKKSLLIPFLLTHGREQLHNARLLEHAGIASILPQSELSYPKLEQEIAGALRRPAAKSLNLPVNAAARLVDDLVSYV